MRYICLLFCALLSTNVFTAEKIQVFLFAGQSNMDGRGDGNRITAKEQEQIRAAQKQIQFFYNHGTNVFGAIDPSKNISRKFSLSKVFGPELFFGLKLTAAMPKKQFIFIKRAEGGTSLYGCWNPDWTEEKAGVMNEKDKPRLYADFVQYTKDVLSGYKSGTYEICGILWVQGEADSSNPVAAAEYGKNLINLIIRLRADLDAPDVPFLMMQVGSDQVKAAMTDAVNQLPAVYTLPMHRDPASADYYTTYGPPIGHYDYEGMKKIGMNLAEVYLHRTSEHGR